MSATSGGTVRVSFDRVLRAVAVDAAGNVSPVMAAAYDLPYTGKVGVLAPGSWAVTSGGAPRGGAAETTADDGRELAVGSTVVGTRQTVDVTATVAVPADLRAAQAVSVSMSHRATLRGTRVRAQWYDVTASTWRALATTTQGLDEARVDVDMTTITNWLDAGGNLKVRLIADNGAPFDLVVDRVAVTAVNRR
jgi:manganese oxidase